MSQQPTSTQAWWHDIPELLDDAPPLTLDQLQAIALRQSYSIPALLSLHDEEMARYDESELPIDIDHEALEAYYESLSDIPY